MREILFRGKRANNKEWVEGGIIPLDADSGYVFIAEPFLSASTLPIYEIIKHHTHLVIPETVGQYTGLTDKNGKRIFEGDILLVKTTLDSVDKVTRDDEYIVKGIVVFNEGHFELDGEGLILFTYWGGKSLFKAAHFKEYEVIGNIHDNPELLKGGEEQ